MSIVIKVGEERASWWKSALQDLLPDEDIFLWRDSFDPATVTVVVAWEPQTGWIAGFPNVECIVSIGAGIDHILEDSLLPRHIPIIRTVNSDLRQRMTAFVVLHVLRYHRDLDRLVQANRERRWDRFITTSAADFRVGILGFGSMGRACAEALSTLGYTVKVWRRTMGTDMDLPQYTGPDGFERVLRSSNAVVCLLPLTPETEGILNRRAFEMMPEGAFVINVGRGKHVVEEDLIASLAAGRLGGATLDVFPVEPLPADHPFRGRPNVLITCHTAALIDPSAGAQTIAENIKAFKETGTAPLMTERDKGY